MGGSCGCRPVEGSTPQGSQGGQTTVSRVQCDHIPQMG